MTVKNRIRAINLASKLEMNKKYAEQIGVTVDMKKINKQEKKEKEIIK